MKLKQFPEIILFLNDNPLPSLYTKGVVSGKELRLRSALKHVKKIHVLAPKGEWVGDQENSEIGNLERKIIIHHIPNWPYYLRTIPFFIWGLYWSLKLKPNLIEAESPIISGPAAIALGKLLNLPTVIEVRASYFELIKHKVTWIPFLVKLKILNLVYRHTLKQASGVIANSYYYQGSLRDIGIESAVINPGIQLQSIKVTRTVRASNTVILGYLGRLETEKGAAILLEAMKVVLSQKMITQNIMLFIAGEGTLRKKLESFIEDNPVLRNQVKFLGFQKAQDFLPKIDILINPNIVQHPLEMVNVEAAYYGKPVICFGNEWIPETVLDGITGLKVKLMKASILAGAINKLTSDARLIKSMEQNGKELATHFLFDSQVKRLHALYIQVKLLH